MNIKKILVGVAGSTIMFGILVASALASNSGATQTNKMSYEFDNGTIWTLQKNNAAINTTYPNPSYSDAGIVVDLGKAQGFTGLTWEGSGPLAANIWIGDGSEAYTPGTHLLSNPVDFSYGPWGQSFWSGPEAGKPVDVTTIQGLGSEEVYAWVGITYDGSNSVRGNINSINDQAIGNRIVSFINNGDGTVTAVAH